MGIVVSDTLEDAVNRLASPTGAVLVGAFAAFGFLASLFRLTMFGALVEWAIDTFGADVAAEMGYDVPASAVSVERLQVELVERQQFALAEALETVTTAGLDLSLPAAVVLVATLPFVAEFLHVVAVRAFAGDTGSWPTADVLSGIGGVYATSLLSNFLAWVLVAIGLLLAVLPGLVLAAVFLLVRQHVVLGDDGVVDALGSSYATFRANVGSIVVLFLVLSALDAFATFGLPMLGLPGVLMAVAGASVVAFNLAVATSAYLQTDAAVA